MRVDLFDFDLPPERIALRPADPRDSARMLVVRPSALEDRRVRDLPEFLRPGDVLVVNDTRVIPARLNGIRARGENIARVEATLVKREGSNLWRALAKPAKRIAPGDRIRFGEASESMACLLAALDADVVERNEGEILLSFHLDGAALDEAIELLGHMPLPPYIAARRPDHGRGCGDYPTMVSREPWAVAAPTAGDDVKHRFSQLRGDVPEGQGRERSGPWRRRLDADRHLAFALDWLDGIRHEPSGTSRRDVEMLLCGGGAARVRDRARARGNLDRSCAAQVVHDFYGYPPPGYGIVSVECGPRLHATTMLSRKDWLAARLDLREEKGAFELVHTVQAGD